MINYHLFLKRTLEKSETYTKSIFMYPLIIILSTLSMMLFVYDLGDLKMTTLMFSVIFIIYLIMYYFSKRKVYFSWKIPSLFILLIIGCIGFSNIYSNTKGMNYQKTRISKKSIFLLIVIFSTKISHQLSIIKK